MRRVVFAPQYPASVDEGIRELIGRIGSVEGDGTMDDFVTVSFDNGERFSNVPSEMLETISMVSHAA